MVVDASIVVRLLQNRAGDEPLRERFGQQRYVHAPQLIDAEVASAIRGLLLTYKAEIRISPANRRTKRATNRLAPAPARRATTLAV